MQALARPYGTLHCRIDGPDDAPAVIFANSLGTDLRLWDEVIGLLPQGWRYIRYDKQGHGLSDIGPGAALDDHVADAVAVIEAFAARPAAFIGISLGGLIAQAVAHRRPDLVRALVLSNTAARLGTPESWGARIDALRATGLASIADGVLARWFAPAFLAGPALPLWRNMLVRTPADGYAAACAALAAADHTAATAQLRVPTLAIGGELDGSTPPQLVQATADLIPGATFHAMPGVGHLPPVEAPGAFVDLLLPFLKVHLDD